MERLARVPEVGWVLRRRWGCSHIPAPREMFGVGSHRTQRTESARQWPRSRGVEKDSLETLSSHGDHLPPKENAGGSLLQRLGSAPWGAGGGDGLYRGAPLGARRAALRRASPPGKGRQAGFCPLGDEAESEEGRPVKGQKAMTRAAGQGLARTGVLRWGKRGRGE